MSNFSKGTFIQHAALLNQHVIQKKHVKTAKTGESDRVHSMATLRQGMAVKGRLCTYFTYQSPRRTRFRCYISLGREKRKRKVHHHPNNRRRRDGREKIDRR